MSEVQPLRSRRRRWLRLLLLVLLMLILVWLGGSYAVAYRLTRRPHPLRAEPAPVGDWADVQTLRLSTDDSQQLGAWFIPGHADRPIVLLLHGNGGDRTSCLPQAKFLAGEGCSIFLVTLRAHGDSTGEVNDFGYSARHDVVAAVQWIERERPGRAIVIWGRSLGSAAALFAAEHLQRVKAYILECPYKDLRTAVRHRLELYAPWPLDAVGDVGLRIVSPLVLANADAISPLNAARLVPHSTLALVLAGGRDRRARPEEAHQIADALGADLVIDEIGDHLELSEAVVQTAVRKLLR